MPEALRLQLDALRRHLWRVKILEATAAGIIGLLVSFFFVYGLDRAWQTPDWLRLGILVLGVSGFGGFAPYWLHRWVWRQRRETQLARLIARRFPGLGDRLLGVIELQNQPERADSLSPRLREAAMAAVAMEASQRRLEDALPPSRHSRWAWAALGLVALAFTAVALSPRAGFNALHRWLLPLSQTERYTFVRLENPPLALSVPLGEAFDVTLQLAKNSEQHPALASVRYGERSNISAALATDRYRFTFPGLQEPVALSFRVGDLQHALRVLPVTRPVIESAFATLSFPPALQIADKTVNLNTGAIHAVAGSRIQIQLTLNRPLAGADFGPTRPLSSTPFVANRGALLIQNRTATTPTLDVGAVPFEIPIAWQDQLGIDGAGGFRLRVDAAPDAPPTCYLQGIDRQQVMLADETVDFEVLAEDDYGLKCSGVEWTGEPSRPGSKAAAKGAIRLGQGQPETRRLVHRASFAPAAFGITPQKITLRGYSEDFSATHGRVYSEPIILYVLTRDEHAQLLKTRLDRTITEFEDLARRETGLLDENQRLQRLTGEQLQQDSNTKRLQGQEQASAESKRSMSELTERMEQLMKDAARNGHIEKNTLQKMAGSLKSMQELSQQDLLKVQEKLADAQQRSNTAAQAASDLAAAVQAQEAAVEKMQQAIAKANDADRQFEAGTFVSRLKKAAADESGIATALIDGYARILGIRRSKLDPADQRHLSEAINQQANIASDVRWLQEDLVHYSARTKTELFKQILDQMRTSQIDVGLEEIRTQLLANHSFVATESARKWADQLAAWAKTLEGAVAPPAAGAGGPGSQSPEDEDFEFMLRVMKLVQSEQDLRAQTRALDPLPEKQRRDGSVTLADHQDELSADVQQLTLEQSIPQVIDLLRQVKQTMDEATEQLAQSNTGGETIAAQTEIIEKIHNAAQQQQQAQGGGPAGGAMMDMLERMMGHKPAADSLAKGAKPNESGAPGSETSPPGAAHPAADGGKTVARRVPKSSGTAGRAMPEEFRAALDAYNRAAEQQLK